MDYHVTDEQALRLLPLVTDVRNNSITSSPSFKDAEEVIDDLQRQTEILKTERDAYFNLAKSYETKLKNLEIEKELYASRVKKLTEIKNFLKDRLLSIIAYENQLNALANKYAAGGGGVRSDSQKSVSTGNVNLPTKDHLNVLPTPAQNLNKPSILDIAPNSTAIDNFIDSQLQLKTDPEPTGPEAPLIRKDNVTRSMGSIHLSHHTLAANLLSSNNSHSKSSTKWVSESCIGSTTVHSKEKQKSNTVIAAKTTGSIIQIPRLDVNPLLLIDPQILRSFPIFHDFPQTVLETISNVWYEVRKKAGQVVLREGDSGSEVYFVVDGSIVFMHNDEEEIATLSKGQFFGEIGLLLESPRGATVTAKTDCHLLVLTKNRLMDILKVNESNLFAKVEEAAAQRALWWAKIQNLPHLDRFGREFLLDIARRDLKKLQLFEEADELIIQKLAMNLESIVIPSNSMIISKDDVADCMYFIVHGTVQVVGNDNVVHAEMMDGQFFGEIGILMDIVRTASLRAKDECYLFKLTKNVVEDVCKEYPILHKKIKETAQERYQLYLKRDKKMGQFDLEVSQQSLMKLELFQSLDNLMLQELAISMTRKTYNPTEKIVVCGDPSDSMFFLAVGDADIINEFGELIDTTSGPYSWFGEVGIFQQVPRTANVVAKTTCSVYILSKTNVLSLVNKYPDIGQKIKETAEARMQKYLMRSILA